MTFGTCQRLQLRVMSTAMEPGSAKTFIAARKLSFKPELRAWSVFADLGSLNANTPVGSPPASTTAVRGPLSPIRRRPQDQFRVAGSTMLDVLCTVLDTSSNVSVNWFDGTSWEGRISTERGYPALTFGGHALLPKGSIEFVGPLPTLNTIGPTLSQHHYAASTQAGALYLNQRPNGPLAASMELIAKSFKNGEAGVHRNSHLAHDVPAVNLNSVLGDS
jgi:hypothetical protein